MEYVASAQLVKTNNNNLMWFGTSSEDTWMLRIGGGDFTVAMATIKRARPCTGGGFG